MGADSSDGSIPHPGVTAAIPVDPSSPISDSSSSGEDIVWNGEDSSITAQSPSASSALKRKRYILDHVLLSPSGSSTLDSIPAPDTDPSPRKKSRQSQNATPREYQGPLQRTAELSGQFQPDGRNLHEAGAEIPPPNSTQEERDSFLIDMENCLESILNELAEETQQRESLQERYASELFRPVSDISGTASPISVLPTATYSFLPAHGSDASDDELSQNLFDRFQSLTLDAEYSGAHGHSQLDVVYDNTTWDDIVDAGFNAELAGSLPSFSILDRTSPTPPTPPLGSGSPSSALPQEYDVSGGPEAQFKTLEPDAHLWGELDMDIDIGEPEIYLHSASPSDSHDADASRSESGFIPDGRRSHCPCIQCSSKPPTAPNFMAAWDSGQQEIHRLFNLSPFAQPTNDSP
ncbi:hypothetical protein MVEN_01951500 [Mycena venus]|uniref:Uncharacterized protein n=1 Tax=Mycena venus TaxID=2733690 RepID=A0A8H6XH30_9AGAR|nr:hypothetical protein MVEN_01951500 [Mycena venus]